MPVSPWDFDTDSDAHDVLRPKSNQLGLRTALIGLCIAFFIAAIWFVSSPSFEKCSAVENVTDRNACYDGLRKELLKPPQRARISQGLYSRQAGKHLRANVPL